MVPASVLTGVPTAKLIHFFFFLSCSGGEAFAGRRCLAVSCGVDLGPRHVIAPYTFPRREPHRLMLVLLLMLLLVVLVLLLTEVLMEVLYTPWGRHGCIPNTMMRRRLRGTSGESIGKWRALVGLCVVLKPWV